MKRTLRAVALMVAALSAVACSQNEANVTSGYGNSTVSGQVVPVDDLAGTPAAGIEVSALGTGITVVTDAEGRFQMFGVPSEQFDLAFKRADGVAATLGVTGNDRNLTIELSKRVAAKSRRRGVGHPGAEIEGIVKEVSADKIVVTDSRSKLDLDSAIDENTVIRKGNQDLTIEDIAVGDRVHVKAKHVDGARVAVEIKLQNKAGEEEGDDDGEETNSVTANGIVQEVGDSYLVVLTADGRTIRVNVDENTQIKRRGREFALADMKPGDRAESLGTRVDDTTILARKIETQDRQ
jgi:hypothetical protein